MQTHGSNVRKQEHHTLGDVNERFNQGSSQVPVLFSTGDNGDVSLHCRAVHDLFSLAVVHVTLCTFT